MTILLVWIFTSYDKKYLSYHSDNKTRSRKDYRILVGNTQTFMKTFKK